VSELVLGNLDPAINSLRQTIVVGDSPYLEDAHFYLAEAFLRRNDPLAAESELNQVIAGNLRGARSKEALRLLEVIHQQMTGTISGTVVDSTGAAFPGVRVIIRSVDTPGTRIFFVDAAGDYFARLPVGNYDVTFVTPTIKTRTFVVRGRTLHGGEDLKIHPSLSRETPER
jgi:carboxypeptidase family protein